MASPSFYLRLIFALCGVLFLSACASVPTSLPGGGDAVSAVEPRNDANVETDADIDDDALIDSELGSDRNVRIESDAQENLQATVEKGVLSERVRQERADAFNPYVLTAHKHNFILPVSYTTGINQDVYEENDVPLGNGLQPAEVKFQISLKSQLNEGDLFFKNDALSVGITLEAWWQLYSSALSSPFRETNYQPEIFYLVPLLWGPFGGSTAVILGFEHQSNGQVQGLSRSWNRLYATLIYERGAFVAHVRPWYRIPEKAKESLDAAEGDDNPDILDFMGHGEAGMSWRKDRLEYAVRARGNPTTGKGAITIGMTFPLFAKFRGFVQYFNGYGDSLIDYDHHQQRLGVGVALNSLF